MFFFYFLFFGFEIKKRKRRKERVPLIGNLLISYVNVRAIGKECTLTGKELLPRIFVAFVSPKLKHPMS